MTATILTAGLIAVQTAMTPMPALQVPGAGEAEIRRVAVDCSGAAAQVVSQTGGQLLSASAQSQGGQAVCVITVLVPGTGSERPKKVTISVPQ
ncbi:hypothetical protein [uncultured Hoeflea sp.]|uniref:hypothetical protein n=1 Tax=uncultured Hoeflea sp. TaxID=538666 RepID=UPI002635B1E2|nr:hypothetical protein [uncultured Hoeflea sp.]